ncbi:hypothetical protein ACJJTC_012621 [Scirpophaga incertulas]
MEEASAAYRLGRPSLSQVRAIIKFMKEHPDLAQQRLKYAKKFYLYKRHWSELSNIVNSMDGARKSTKGWRKYWSDKRRNILLKDKQIKEGKLAGSLSSIDRIILQISDNQFTTRRTRKTKTKKDSCNGDVTNDVQNDLLIKDSDNDEDDLENNARRESNEQHLRIMDKLVSGVMGQQSASLLQVAKSQLDNSRSMEQLAESSYMQAFAVDRIATSFESISTYVHNLKNSVLGIDATLRRDRPNIIIQSEPNSHLFS